jgi:Mycothiol maleylpyruvate isomerase N-terminal domain
MNNRDFVEENNASRLELNDLISRLDERSFNIEVGPGWTVSTVLCHLAFWDQRVLFVLKKWKSAGFEPSRLTPLSVDSINQAAAAIARAVPGPAAARLAIESAAAVDSQVAETGDELASQMLSAGFERFLRRYLHRREHLQKIEKALAAQSA